MAFTNLPNGPSFWAAGDSEPKRSYRYILNINGIDIWTIKTVAKPNFSISESKHAFLNYEFKFPGRVTWQDVQVTLVDPMIKDATASIWAMLQTSGYVLPDKITDHIDNPVTISKRASSYALNDQVLIKQVDSEGKGFIEVWKLWNPWIKSVNFGSLDYASDELVNIQMTIAYDWAELNPQSAGVFAPFGQASEDAANRASETAAGRPGGANYNPTGG